MSSNIVQSPQVNPTIVNAESASKAQQKIEAENNKLLSNINNLKQQVSEQKQVVQEVSEESDMQQQAIQYLRLLFVFVLLIVLVYIGLSTKLLPKKLSFILLALIEVGSFIKFILINYRK